MGQIKNQIAEFEENFKDYLVERFIAENQEEYDQFVQDEYVDKVADQAEFYAELEFENLMLRTQ